MFHGNGAKIANRTDGQIAKSGEVNAHEISTDRNRPHRAYRLPV
jgi:hypothetical protein